MGEAHGAQEALANPLEARLRDRLAFAQPTSEDQQQQRQCVQVLQDWFHVRRPLGLAWLVEPSGSAVRGSGLRGSDLDVQVTPRRRWAHNCRGAQNGSCVSSLLARENARLPRAGQCARRSRAICRRCWFSGTNISAVQSPSGQTTGKSWSEDHLWQRQHPQIYCKISLRFQKSWLYLGGLGLHLGS